MTCSMVAVVGADGNIGPQGGLPEFMDNGQRDMQARWFDQLSVGSIIVMGSTTIRIMKSMGFTGVDNLRQLVPWTRDLGESPEDFLSRLSTEGLPILIAGGATTFRLFAPLCDNYYLRRSSLVNPPDHRLDPILPIWQNRNSGPTDRLLQRMS